VEEFQGGLAIAIVSASTLGVGGLELGLASGSAKLAPLFTATAGARAAGGAVNGALSQFVQGGDVPQIIIGAGVNALVSAANPFSFIGGTAVGQAAPTFANVVTGGLNSLTANIGTQATGLGVLGTAVPINYGFANLPGWVIENRLWGMVAWLLDGVFMIAGAGLLGLLGGRLAAFLIVKKFGWMTEDEVRDFSKRDPGI
jgi:hypothetical protein